MKLEDTKLALIVPRPFGEGEEKGLGTYMSADAPIFIRMYLYSMRCTNKPHTWRLHNYRGKDHTLQV